MLPSSTPGTFTIVDLLRFADRVSNFRPAPATDQGRVRGANWQLVTPWCVTTTTCGTTSGRERSIDRAAMQLIQAFFPNRPHPAFGKGVRVGCM